MARILGINHSQDASIAILDTTRNQLFALRKERLDQKKHSWGAVGDFQKYYSQIKELTEFPIDLVVECYSSDGIRVHQKEIREDIANTITFSENNGGFLEVGHHKAHLFSTLPFMETEKAAGVVIDFQGSPQELVDALLKEGETGVNIDLDKDVVEVASVYSIDKQGEYKPLGKHLWDLKKAEGLGAFYSMLTHCFFNGLGSEGKVMALASFGNPDAWDLPPLDIVDGCKVVVPEAWLKVFEESNRFDLSKDMRDDYYFNIDAPIPNLHLQSEDFQKCADLSYAGQKAFEEALFKIMAWSMKEAGCNEILFSGGTALNCAANGQLSKQFPEAKIQVPGWPDDGGTSIGAAVFGAKYLDDIQNLPKVSLDYVGTTVCSKQNADAAKAVEPEELMQGISKKEFDAHDDPSLLENIAELLAEGYVVGVCQGESEFGPRALGHRSLIADPRRTGVQDFINFRIKGREWFRPVAPIVLDTHADEYFETYRGADFMQYAVDMKKDTMDKIPGVKHVDATARVQTLQENSNPTLYKLISRFHEKTGVPIVINTSLNPKDATIIQTREEALNMLEKTDMYGLVYDSTFYYKEKDPSIKVEDDFLA